MILFLDDCPNRTRTFRSSVPWAKCATTAQGMITLLSETETACMAFLDHDLGGEEFVDSGREDCGMEVVRWIVQNKPDVGQFIVHSFNHDAAVEMEKKLRDAGYNVVRVPFSRLPYEQIERAWANWNRTSLGG